MSGEEDIIKKLAEKRIEWMKKWEEIKTECPVCHTMQKPDILYHGKGSCGMSWECGHTIHSSKEVTIYCDEDGNELYREYPKPKTNSRQRRVEAVKAARETVYGNVPMPEHFDERQVRIYNKYVEKIAIQKNNFDWLEM